MSNKQTLELVVALAAIFSASLQAFLFSSSPPLTHFLMIQISLSLSAALALLLQKEFHD